MPFSAIIQTPIQLTEDNQGLLRLRSYSCATGLFTTFYLTVLCKKAGSLNLCLVNGSCQMQVKYYFKYENVGFFSFLPFLIYFLEYPSFSCPNQWKHIFNYLSSLCEYVGLPDRLYVLTGRCRPEPSDIFQSEGGRSDLSCLGVAIRVHHINSSGVQVCLISPSSCKVTLFYKATKFITTLLRILSSESIEIKEFWPVFNIQT